MSYTQIFTTLPSKVSRRILFTVACCAVIPIIALVFLTLYSTQQRLETDTSKRLQSACKNIGIALYSELSSIETEMRQMALMQNAEDYQGEISRPPVSLSKKTLQRIWFFSSFKQLSNLPYQPTEEILQRLNSQLPQLTILPGTPQNTLLLWVPVQSKNGKWGISFAEINIGQLLHQAKLFLPENTRALLTDNFHQYHLFDSHYSIPVDIHSNSNEIDIDNEKYLIAHSELPLKETYNSLPWHIIVAEPKRIHYSALFDLQVNTALTAFVTLWIILIASMIWIRKTLLPLRELKKATTKIGSGDFNLDLQISSHDEFSALADSFSSMASKIQSQISFQHNLGQAVRNVYGAANEDQIVRNFFDGLHNLLEVCAASLVIYTRGLNRFETKRWKIDPNNPTVTRSFPLPDFNLNDYAQLIQSSKHFICLDENNLLPLIKPFNHLNAKSFWHFHTTIDSQHGAILTLIPTNDDLDTEALTGTRQLADQLGIALSRNSMLQELEALNMGVLTALARTVDANSPWTHGHSERVTEYALNIARTLGFSKEQCLDLQRASLLHDLGKIAIASEVLNKPAPLNSDEIRQMQEHPAEADRIIEPISAFSGIRPIVRQHHERWDGSGYPHGLKGQDICVGARILAVADVYDALYSNRPYRSGWPQEKVISYLSQHAGKAFDPVIVDAFIKTLRQEAAA